MGLTSANCQIIISIIISNTVQKYEEEIKQLEAEQGNDVKFINPEVGIHYVHVHHDVDEAAQPGFVLKTKLADSDLKVFVNICQV